MSHNNQTRGFIAEEACLEFYNAKALIDLSFEFVYLSDDPTPTETDFGFEGYQSGYFRVYNEREGVLLKNFTTQITRDSNNLIMNCSVYDMTFADLGKYYYEMGYNRFGYEVPLRFGDLTII